MQEKKTNAVQITANGIFEPPRRADTRRKPALKLQILYDVEIPVKCLFLCIRKEQADDGMAIV